jgi:PKD repeat protein
VLYVPGGGVYGWARIDNVKVVVDAAEVPSTTASASPTSGALPLVVNFSGGVTSPIEPIVATWWDFGDGPSSYSAVGGGSTSTDANPIFTYVTAGNLYASWTAEDGLGAARTTLVNVQPGNTPPVAILGADPDHGPAPLLVQFTATESHDPDGTIASYHWDFGDGSSSTASVVSRTFLLPGSYLVTLTVTDNFGAANSTQIVIVAQ